MVPVGGAIVASASKTFSIVKDVGRLYPGRASGSTSIDLFITFLSMGCAEYRSLIQQRKQVFQILKSSLETFAPKYNQRILKTPSNKISIGLFLCLFLFLFPIFSL